MLGLTNQKSRQHPYYRAHSDPRKPLGRVCGQQQKDDVFQQHDLWGQGETQQRSGVVAGSFLFWSAAAPCYLCLLQLPRCRATAGPKASTRDIFPCCSLLECWQHH